jgi:hypothetical protein
MPRPQSFANKSAEKKRMKAVNRTWHRGNEAHHLFGFHDVSPWNSRHDRMLSLEVATIDHPPLTSEPARVGVIDLETLIFHQHDTTTGWNFPQGARQLWLCDRSRYAYNCPDGDHPRTRIRDQSGRLIRELPWGIAGVCPASDVLYSIDFGRVHRAGGYGHTGSRLWSAGNSIERAGGLVSVEISSGAAKTLASLADCRCVTGRPNGAGRVLGLCHSCSAEPFRKASFLSVPILVRGRRHRYRSLRRGFGRQKPSHGAARESVAFRLARRGEHGHLGAAWANDHQTPR